jgi:hypothetical protein
MTPTQAIERLRKYDLIGEWSAIRSGSAGTFATYKITPQCTDKGSMEEDSARLAVVARNTFPLLLAAVEAADRAKTLQVEYFRACALSGDDLVSRTRKQYEAAASAWSNFDFALSALARKVEEMGR